MACVATLWPAGMRPRTEKSSTVAPPTSWLRAITTSSAGWRRIKEFIVCSLLLSRLRAAPVGAESLVRLVHVRVHGGACRFGVACRNGIADRDVFVDGRTT